jgi:DNA-binding Lrp family transcriptional regulator
MKKRKTHYIDIDIDLLKKLYVDERKTLQYMSENIFFVSNQTLISRLKEHDIKRNIPEGKKSNYLDINVELLKELYYNQKKSMYEVSNYFDCSWHVILRRMKENNLPRRHRADWIRKK